MTALTDHRIVPLATPLDDQQADALADGLVQGGIPVVEIAFRSDYALEGLRRIASRGDILVGAGTVLNVEQAQLALDAGASFLVSPGLDVDVVRFALRHGIDVLPGVMTPSEVQAAIALGLRRLKLFPAGVLGGIRMLDALGAVFQDVRFMPSGGVNQDNLAEHLKHPSVFAASGSWITRPELLARGIEAVAQVAGEAKATVDA